MAFSQLKPLPRKAAAGTVGALWDAIVQAIDAFIPHECRNHFAEAGYDRKYTESALERGLLIAVTQAWKTDLHSCKER